VILSDGVGADNLHTHTLIISTLTSIQTPLVMHIIIPQQVLRLVVTMLLPVL
jgi:hypothetical protein